MGFIRALFSILIIIGALNWGSVGLFDFNIIDYIFRKKFSFIGRIIYILIGFAGLYIILYQIFT